MAAKNKEQRDIEIILNAKQADATMNELAAAARVVEKQLRNWKGPIDEFKAKSKDLQEIKGRFKDMNDEIQGTNKSLVMFKNQFIAITVGTLGSNLILAAFQKLTGIFDTAVSSAARLSDELSDIKRTTGMTTEEAKALNVELGKIDTRTSKSDLRKVGFSAGQLGVAKQDIAEFIKSIDMLSVALQGEFSSAEEASTTIGLLRNVFGDIKSQNVGDDILHIGNALNALGQSGLATAKVVSEFSGRIGGVAIPLGFTSSQVLGLSATLQELNVASERGSSAITRILQTMLKTPAVFSKVAGVSVKEFTTLLNTDLFGAFTKVAEGFKKNTGAATEFVGLLDKMGIDGVGASEVFSKLGGNVGMLKEKVELAGKSLNTTNGIVEQFNEKNNNTAAVIEKTKKKIAGLFEGQTIQSFAVGSMKALAVLVDALIALPKWIGENKTAFMLLGGAIITFNGTMIAARATALADIAVKKLQEFWTWRTFQAQYALNNAIKANPLMMVIGVAFTLLGVYSLLSKKTEEVVNHYKDLNKIGKDYKENMQAQKLTIESLFKPLKDGNQSLDEKRTTIKRINDAYGQYLPNLLTEKSSLDEIAKAEKSVIAAMNEKLVMQAMQEESNKIFQRQIELLKQRDQWQKTVDIGKNAQSNANKHGGDSGIGASAWKALQEINKINNEIAYGKNLANALTEKYKAMAKELGIAFLEIKKVDNATGGGDDGSKKKAYLDMMEAEKKLTQEMLELQSKQVSDERAKIELDFIAQKQKLDNEYKDVVNKELLHDAYYEYYLVYLQKLRTLDEKQAAEKIAEEKKYQAQRKQNLEEDVKETDAMLTRSLEERKLSIAEDYADNIIGKHQYNAEIEQAELDTLELQLQFRKAAGADTLDVEKAIAEKRIKLLEGEAATAKQIAEKRLELFNAYGAASSNIAASIITLVDNAEDAALDREKARTDALIAEDERLHQERKEGLDNELTQGINSKEEHDRLVAKADKEATIRKDKLNADLALKERKIRHEQAIRAKREAEFNAAIAAPEAIIKAFALGSYPLAILTGIAVAAELAMIEGQEVPELADGGYADVVGAKTKNRYRAMLTTNAGGYYSTPTAIVGEGGKPEYVISGPMMQNPAVANVAAMLEGIRTSRTYKNNGFANASSSSTGSGNTAAISGGGNGEVAAALQQNTVAIAALLHRLDNPKPSKNYIVYQELDEKMQEVKLIKDRAAGK